MFMFTFIAPLLCYGAFSVPFIFYVPFYVLLFGIINDDDDYNATQLRRLSMCWNTLHPKVFHFIRWG